MSSYFTTYDFGSEFEMPAQCPDMSGQHQLVATPAPQLDEFGSSPGYSPSYSPGYSPVSMAAYPSPALTNNVSLASSPYQVLESECGMTASFGLVVTRAVQPWNPTGVQFASPGYQFPFTAPPVQFNHGLLSPSPPQPPRRMPPTASAKSTAPTKRPGRSFPCSQCKSTFTRPADVKRHINTVHNPIHSDCPIATCSRKGRMGFPRRDHMVEHLRSYHHYYVPKRGYTGAKGVVKP